MRLLPSLLLASCLLALATGRLLAQSTFGEILGTVHDSSGAVVQGVRVTLANTGTSATRSEVTDAMEAMGSRTSMWEPIR
jgi:hypothetical protein